MKELHPYSPEERRKRLARLRARFGKAAIERAKREIKPLIVAKRVAVGIYDDGFIHAGNLAYLALLALFPFMLMGHSAGAHLVALVGTDPRYLQTAGVPMSAIKGVVLLDGAGYDVPSQASAEMNLVKPMYEAAFGSDPKRQAALSPTRNAAAPNVARWLILPIERRQDSQAQSKGLAEALNRTGASAAVVVVPGESHGSLNKGLGESGHFATGQVESFLAATP